MGLGLQGAIGGILPSEHPQLGLRTYAGDLLIIRAGGGSLEGWLLAGVLELQAIMKAIKMICVETEPLLSNRQWGCLRQHALEMQSTMLYPWLFR